MALPSPVLPRSRPDPYRPDVSRAPKNFRIDSVSVQPLQPRGYLPTGPDEAVPTRFEAHFVLGAPEASVTIEVFVDATLGPKVVDLAIRTNARASITTSILRQVLVDQLIQRAMAAATVPAGIREGWLSSLPISAREPARAPDGTRTNSMTADERARVQADEDAHTAARLWSDAIKAGRKDPGIAVAEGMSRSRSQVSRYIRRARQMGLLPPT